MMQNPRAIKGMLKESMVRKLIDISKLDPNTRLLIGGYLGDYYPVKTSFETSENLITINIPVPRIVGTKNKRIDDSREGSLSIKKLRGETHILSLDLRTFGNLYTDVIDISDDVINALMDNSRDSCGMFHIGHNRLMSVLYGDGCAIDFTGGYIVTEETQPIVEFLSAGYKTLIAQRAGEDEPVAEAAEQEEAIDAEIVGEEKPVPTETKFDPDEVLEEDYIIENLGMAQATLEKHKEKLTVDGKYTKGKVAGFNVESKGIRLTPAMRIKRLKELGLDIETLEEAAEKLGEYGIKAELGIRVKKPVTEKAAEPSPVETQYSGKEMSDEQIADVLGIARERIRDYLYKGFLRGRTVGDVAGRIHDMKSKRDRTKLEMYNQLVEEAEIKGIGEFSNEDEAYSALTKGIKKKLV